MAYDEKTTERVRRLLARRRDLAEKKMMGAVCFLVNGSMCCGVTGSALMVRVGREAYERTLAEPHVRPLELGGRRAGGFVLVDPAGHRTEAALAAWVQRGIDFVSTLPVKKPDRHRGSRAAAQPPRNARSRSGSPRSAAAGPSRTTFPRRSR